MKNPTHAELVVKATRCLKSQRCTVVFAECGAAYSLGEIPDAIGWNYWGESIMVECKTPLSQSSDT